MSAEAPFTYIFGSLTLLVFVFFLILILIEYRKRQVYHIAEKLELEHQYQSEVLQAQLEVQEQSFKYISEELHDNISQTLSVTKLKLYKLSTKVTDDAVKEGIDASTELLGNALSDIRNLSHILNGGLVSRLTLRESIDKELNYLRGVKDIEIQFTVTGAPLEPSPEKKLMIFRVVQETINNAIKHAEATEINISLDYQPGTLGICISDNGKGFDVDKVEHTKGLGLHNMHVRAKMLGNLSIVSEHDQGTTIMLNVITNE